jgi:hypothetical protein
LFVDSNDIHTILEKWSELNREGVRLMHEGQLQMAETYFRKAGNVENLPVNTPHRYLSLGNLASVLHQRKDHREARRMFYSALSELKHFPDLSPSVAASMHYELASALEALKEIDNSMQELTTASKLYLQASSIVQEQLDQSSSPSTNTTLRSQMLQYQKRAANSNFRRAEMSHRTGSWEAAETLLLETVSIMENVVANSPTHDEVETGKSERELGEVIRSLAAVQMDLGKDELAKVSYMRTLDILAKYKHPQLIPVLSEYSNLLLKQIEQDPAAEAKLSAMMESARIEEKRNASNNSKNIHQEENNDANSNLSASINQALKNSSVKSALEWADPKLNPDYAKMNEYVEGLLTDAEKKQAEVLMEKLRAMGMSGDKEMEEFLQSQKTSKK